MFLEPLECEELDLSCSEVPATMKLSLSSIAFCVLLLAFFLLALANFTSVFISSLHSSVSVTSSCSSFVVFSASLLAKESSMTVVEETSSHLGFS